MKLTYAVVFEQTPNNYCASVPDVPGCVEHRTATHWDEMQAMIREAWLAFHIEEPAGRGATPSPSRRCPSTEAIAYHNEPIPEDVLSRPTPSTATTPPRSRRGSSSWRSRSRPRLTDAGGMTPEPRRSPRDGCAGRAPGRDGPCGPRLVELRSRAQPWPELNLALIDEPITFEPIPRCPGVLRRVRRRTALVVRTASRSRPRGGERGGTTYLIDAGDG